MPPRYDVAVVGGGASGLAASISAARQARSVVLCERMPRLGKKILVTGGGRCNLSNENLEARFFTSTRSNLPSAAFERFGGPQIRRFFEDLGLYLISEGDRVYPSTNQASSVLKVLELEIRRRRIAVALNFTVSGAAKTGTGFSIRAADGRRIEAAALILAAGGKSYPALGANGSGYALAEEFGHTLIPPVPSAVPLLAKDPLCHWLQGQRLKAHSISVIDGIPAETADGEVLFTQYGLSGTAVLDVSESLSIAVNRRRNSKCAVVLDLVPFMSREALSAEFKRRLDAGWDLPDLISGILPEKFAPALKTLLPPSERRHGDVPQALAAVLKNKSFQVSGTRGWNEAEFTSGGVDAREIEERTLRSNLHRGLYFAGEMLDVQGKRGGYNLAWAWASGYIAGLLE